MAEGVSDGPPEGEDSVVAQDRRVVPAAPLLVDRCAFDIVMGEADGVERGAKGQRQPLGPAGDRLVSVAAL